MSTHSVSNPYVLAAAAMLLAACTPEAEDPRPAARPELFDYVAAPEPAYEWRVRARYERGTTEIVELRLHSQTWRDTLWKHRLFLIRPETVTTGDDALLIVGGGRWSEADDASEPPSELPDGSNEFIGMAEAMETVVAVVGTVPFQPLMGRTEDELIAHTFERYLETRESDWPLLLPMTKSAVAAMDAVQAATDELWGRPTEGFTVIGGSKRGWATWLTAVVDERVNAIAPLVFDALEMDAHFPHQTAAWGAPSQNIHPYTQLGLDEILSSEEGATLRRIVDPYAYRAELTEPKLIVNATNDEYFPLDSANLYWDGLEAPKYLVYAPNQPHGIEDLELLVPSINALHQAASGGAALPDLAWEYAPTDSGLRLCLRADPAPAPAEVTRWQARSPDRDFRDDEWTSSRVERTDGTYVLDLPRPDSGYSAAYADLTFDHGAAPYYLSTSVAIMNAHADERVSPSPADHGDVCDQTEPLRP